MRPTTAANKDKLLLASASHTAYGRRGERGHFKNNRAIVALVERGGNVRTFHVAHADKVTVTKTCARTSRKKLRLHTDESSLVSRALASPISRRMKPCATRCEGIRARRRAHEQRRKATSQSSSAGCVASTSIAARSICTVTLPSMTFAITIASNSVSVMGILADHCREKEASWQASDVPPT